MGENALLDPDAIEYGSLAGRAGSNGPRATLQRRVRLSAAQLAALSFVALIVLGTFGFRLLPGLTTDGNPLGWLESLFMATSAVCVTGLAVVDVSTELSFRGQVWLLLLIQLGALGIFTLAGLVLSLMGLRMGLDLEEAAQGGSPPLPRQTAARMLRNVVVFTFAIEAIGALLLWLLWRSEPPAGANVVWLAVFHSVSAFCNAGFSLFSDSLIGFQQRPGLLGTIAGLIIVGGLGFPVLLELRDLVHGKSRGRSRVRIRRLSLHARLVLGATGIVLVGSTGLYVFCEWSRELGALGPVDRLVNAFFMAVTARTAGFNTVDYDGLSNGGIFLTLALMWIGGAPGSVAGGVKVTTVAILALLLFSRLTGATHTSLAGRTIPRETVQRAAGLAAGAVFLLAALLMVLLLIEPTGASGAAAGRVQLVRLIFELQSAFSTVGLSMGSTGELTAGGRWLIIVTMLLGRLGPLVVLTAMAVRVHRRVDFRYAHEDVLVG
jgi:trk system potassium uptake protein TrkH